MKWTKDDTTRFAEMWHAGVSVRDLAEHFGRSDKAIESRVGYARLGTRSINPKLKWTEADQAVLAEMWSTDADIAVIAERFDRTIESVRTQAYRTCLGRRKNIKRVHAQHVVGLRWTSVETATLVSSWQSGMTTAEISVVVGRTPEQVISKASHPKLSARNKTVAGTQDYRLIPCISCSREFGSTHRFNRMCDACLAFAKTCA